MGLRTRYDIYSTNKTAPVLSTYDRLTAQVEFNDLLGKNKGEFYRLQQQPEAVGELTKSEEYVLLVWRVRRLIRRYYDNGRKREDLVASLEHEQKLDQWNKRTRAFIDAHPGYKPKDEKSHAFYVLVSEWRRTWNERMAYRKRKMGYDQKVMDEMSKKCRDLEKQVDNYIKEKLQLL